MTNKFITLEGTEGVGKSTIANYLKEVFENAGVDFITTREPGGTPIAEQIRSILISHGDEELTTESEVLLMFACRSQHLEHVIKPALQEGKWVVSDRYVDASYAYQGGGRGLPMAQIRHLEELVAKELEPSNVLLLDAPLEIAMARTDQRGAPDRFETERQDFFKRVQATYLERAKQSPQRYHIIDAGLELDDVKAQVKSVIEKILKQ